MGMPLNRLTDEGIMCLGAIVSSARLHDWFSGSQSSFLNVLIELTLNPIYNGGDDNDEEACKAVKD